MAMVEISELCGATNNGHLWKVGLGFYDTFWRLLESPEIFPSNLSSIPRESCLDLHKCLYIRDL
jgi:hypothetical protein